MTQHLKCKVLLVGPCKAGKTYYSNILAGFEKNDEYVPTKGVRIHEFEREMQSHRGGKQLSMRVEVELWDCSGDPKYKAGWPALQQDVTGVVILYNPEKPSVDRDVDQWYRDFCSSLRLSENQVMLMSNSFSGSADPNIKFSKPIENVKKNNYAHLTLKSEEDEAVSTFDKFLGSLVTHLMKQQK